MGDGTGLSGKTHVYSPADYYFHYKAKFTDTVFINWTGEGPKAEYIEKVSQPDPSTWYFVLKSQYLDELTIKYVDKANGIAIFRMKYYNPVLKKRAVWYQLMADVQKMRNIPLLVNTCDNEKQPELDFDEVDYSKQFRTP